MQPLNSMSRFIILAAALFLSVTAAPEPPATGSGVFDYQQTKSAELSPQTDKQQPIPTKGQWRLEVRTQGGINGLGIGDIFINAQGEVMTTGASGGCQGKLSEERLKQIEQMVTSAKLILWKTSYVHPDNPSGCCDQIKWSLSLSWNESSGLGRMYASSWYDDSKSLLPTDLNSLRAAVMSAKEAVLSDCRK